MINEPYISAQHHSSHRHWSNFVIFPATFDVRKTRDITRRLEVCAIFFYNFPLIINNVEPFHILCSRLSTTRSNYIKEKIFINNNKLLFQNIYKILYCMPYCSFLSHYVVWCCILFTLLSSCIKSIKKTTRGICTHFSIIHIIYLS